MRRAALLVTLVALVAPAAASAHATLRAEFPGFQQELRNGPAFVRLHFDQLVQLPTIEVLDVHGVNHAAPAVARGLDVSAKVLSRYGLPLRPVGQGSSDAALWARFLDHATAIEMPEFSAWRYGVVSGDVWPLLSERSPSGQEYTVQPGDTLGRISRMWGVDVMRIAVANRLADPNVLFVGQVLCIPLG